MSQSHLALQWCEGEELVCSSVLLKIISLLLSLIMVTICLVSHKYKAGLTVVACAYLKVGEVLKLSIMISDLTFSAEISELIVWKKYTAWNPQFPGGIFST